MKVSVFGLGYVGAVTSACLARDGIGVIGVDVNQAGEDVPVLDLGGLCQQSPEGTSYAGSCW